MTTVQKTTRRRCSARVSVPFLTALAAAGILAGCSKDPAEEANTADTAIVDTFVNAADCVASERYDQATCDRLEALGRSDYASQAKPYATLEDCQRDTQSDQCDDTVPLQPLGGATGDYASNATPPAYAGGHAYYYSPAYRGFSVARAAPESSEPLVARAVYSTPSGLSTFSGVEGLKTGEAMSAPRASFSQMFRGAARFFAGESFSAHAPVISARGGFGSSFRGFSMGG